ncbi:stalk domain-containing protein [Ammoniphilus resinae]|uniref:Copper amine oxidase-like N-terminal domain-containing protein n=1 Tax=Ammoniphilus resinae TaxID=861532 RepID=A0ABS4GWX8_9BACL|nr:hypothetical protein [Ammoniphilus resinae]
MKKILTGFLLGSIFFSGISFAASKIDVSFLPLSFYIDGEKKELSQGQQGFIYNGTTYVPLRFIGESLGKEVEFYKGKTNTIYIGKKSGGSEYQLEKVNPTSKNLINSSQIGSSFESNQGGKFNSGYIIGQNLTDSFGWIKNEYTLNNEYERFEAIVVPHKNWSGKNKNDNVGNLKIYADGKLVFSTGNISSDLKEPIEVKVSLTGVSKLKIDCVGADLGLLEAKLVKEK